MEKDEEYKGCGGQEVQQGNNNRNTYQLKKEITVEILSSKK